MNTKDNILDNLTQYTPRTLAEYIDKGVITWDDMRDTGDLIPSLRKAVEEQISQIAQVEDNDWDRALATDTESAFQDYLSKYPSGKFADDARDRIAELLQEDNKIQVEDEWDSLDKYDIEALRTFIRNNPGNSHVTEARAKINELQREKRRGNGPRLVISAIKDGYNSNRPDLKIPELLKGYLNSNRISSRDISTVNGEYNNIMEAEIDQTQCN